MRKMRMVKGRTAARGKRSKLRRQRNALALLFRQEAKSGLSDGGHTEARNLMAKGIEPPGR